MSRRVQGRARRLLGGSRINRGKAERDIDERAAAAPIEAADHLGAAFGALVTGALWLPAYGLVATALLFAGLKATAVAGSLAAVRRR